MTREEFNKYVSEMIPHPDCDICDGECGNRQWDHTINCKHFEISDEAWVKWSKSSEKVDGLRECYNIILEKAFKLACVEVREFQKMLFNLKELDMVNEIHELKKGFMQSAKTYPSYCIKCGGMDIDPIVDNDFKCNKCGCIMEAIR